MTSEVILRKLKELRLYYVSIRTDFHQNRLLKECARKNKAK